MDDGTSRMKAGIRVLRDDINFIKGTLDIMEKLVLSRCDPVPQLSE